MCTKELPVYVVDAFAERPFEGNPAAVCLLHTEGELDECTMQRVAAEFNQSETAFVAPRPAAAADTQSAVGTACYSLRWFTPLSEVALCGHATLAATHALVNELGIDAKTVQFGTKSGELTCSSRGNGSYEMIFPAYEVVRVSEVGWPGTDAQRATCHKVAETLIDMCSAISAEELYYAPKAKKLIVKLSEKLNRATLSSLVIAAWAPRQCDPSGSTVKGVCITCANGDSDGARVHFLSRYFAPWVGIDEDPVTGSLHCALAPYWSAKLATETLTGYQCYPGRGGLLHMELITGTDRQRKVKLIGRAVTVVKGKALIPTAEAATS